MRKSQDILTDIKGGEPVSIEELVAVLKASRRLYDCVREVIIQVIRNNPENEELRELETIMLELEREAQTQDPELFLQDTHRGRFTSLLRHKPKGKRRRRLRGSFDDLKDVSHARKVDPLRRVVGHRFNEDGFAYIGPSNYAHQVVSACQRIGLGAAQRLVEGGGVRLNGERLTKATSIVKPGEYELQILQRSPEKIKLESTEK